ncbi:MAG: type III PLP-dependent enzyme [Alphaproteobacteria bacterium]
MNKSPLEPDGRILEENSSTYAKDHKTAAGVATPARFPTVEEMVYEMQPDIPVHCLRPHTIAAMAKRFMRSFPGDTMFAVKTNPNPLVLRYLAAAGMQNFDVASLPEVKLVAENAPGAHMYFMHPVKSRQAIRAAYYEYGVRDFSLDSIDELQKILDETDNADDLSLFVRLIVSNDDARYALSGKFGIALDQAAPLLHATRKAAHRLGVCFHVGSQCMNPQAYSNAITKVAELLRVENIALEMLDVGGGFPSIYPGITPKPLAYYMRAIKKALAANEDQFGQCQLLAEPGRALVAEGGSLVVRVELRKGNALYINDGTYGSLFDAGTPAFTYPVKAIRANGKLAKEEAAFSFFGPTCDSVDAMNGPFHLPKDIKEGDWIEIGQLGSYGAAMRTDFNGFGESKTLEVADKPLLSRANIN